jgi:hypothetical protein
MLKIEHYEISIMTYKEIIVEFCKARKPLRNHLGRKGREV